MKMIQRDGSHFFQVPATDKEFLAKLLKYRSAGVSQVRRRPRGGERTWWGDCVPSTATYYSVYLDHKKVDDAMCRMWTAESELRRQKRGNATVAAKLGEAYRKIKKLSDWGEQLGIHCEDMGQLYHDKCGECAELQDTVEGLEAARDLAVDNYNDQRSKRRQDLWTSIIIVAVAVIVGYCIGVT